MRTLVVGDVHGCSSELRALVNLANPDRVILAGDLFTKGPDPRGVWSLIDRLGMEAVQGNHDAHVLENTTSWKALRLPAEARAWLEKRPLWISGDGWQVIHAGTDPNRRPEECPPAILLNVRRWPDDSRSDHPFWWELYRGPPLVVFGHDARRGLVDRRPHCLGLDTGCVYGGSLSGVLLETGEILQVEAAQTYLAKGGG